MKNLFQKLMKDESGASLIEYVLIAGTDRRGGAGRHAAWSDRTLRPP